MMNKVNRNILETKADFRLADEIDIIWGWIEGHQERHYREAHGEVEENERGGEG